MSVVLNGRDARSTEGFGDPPMRQGKSGMPPQSFGTGDFNRRFSRANKFAPTHSPIALN